MAARACVVPKTVGAGIQPGLTGATLPTQATNDSPRYISHIVAPTACSITITTKLGQLWVIAIAYYGYVAIKM